MQRKIKTLFNELNKLNKLNVGNRSSTTCITSVVGTGSNTHDVLEIDLMRSDVCSIVESSKQDNRDATVLSSSS